MKKYNINVNDDFFYFNIVDKNDYRSIDSLEIMSDKVGSVFLMVDAEGNPPNDEKKILYKGISSNICFDESAIFERKEMAINRMIQFLKENVV